MGRGIGRACGLPAGRPACPAPANAAGGFKGQRRGRACGLPPMPPQARLRGGGRRPRMQSMPQKQKYAPPGGPA